MTPSRPRFAGSACLRLAQVGAVLFAATVAAALPAFAAGGASSTRHGGVSAPMVVDPTISAMCAQVSADSLLAWDQILVGFNTRNTVSDTVSSTAGIGAARRWVKSKFRQLSNRNGGLLQTSYYRFNATVCMQNGSHRNVLATLPGAMDASRIIMLGGHLDSRNVDLCDPNVFAPGANDDASGVLAELEIARIASGAPFDATVILQAFTGEEQSLVGSGSYAQWARAHDIDIVAMLTNDIIGNVHGCPGSPNCGGGQPTDTDSTSVRCFSGGPATGSSRQLARLAKRVAEAYVPAMQVHLQPAIDRPGRGSDHISFYDAGYTSLRFIETLEYTPRQHTSQDLIAFMDFDYLAKNVKINLAVLANLADAPPTPTGLQVFDVGTGGTIRAQWSPLTGIADLAGYRVAWRNADTGDTLYYADVLDAGNTTTYTVSGLANDVPILVSVGAYDQEGHEGIYSNEIAVTPGLAPHAPQGFTVWSKTNQIQLLWKPAQELDLAKHRIFRSLDPVNNFTQVDSLPVGVDTWVDPAAQPGIFYYYRVRSVDQSGLVSAPTAADKGRLVQPQFGILIVDATRDGAGGTGNPTDAQVDAYYESLLLGFPVLDRWDWNTQFANGVIITDADLSRYRAVLVHCDRQLGTIRADTTEIRQYLSSGGRLWISGWEMSFNLGGVDGATLSFPDGTFMHDYCHVDSIRTAAPAETDFEAATSMQSEYPTLAVDTAKWPFNGGHLISMDGFLGAPLFPEQTVSIYKYDSFDFGPNHNLVNGLKYPAVSPKVFFTDLPLYFMNATGSRNLAVQVMKEFGFGGSDVGDFEAERGALELAASRPNPFLGSTSLRFRLASEDRVTLRVVDVQGRIVRTLLDRAIRPAGWNQLDWDGRDAQGRDLQSGVYYVLAESHMGKASRSVTILR